MLWTYSKLVFNRWKGTLFVITILFAVATILKTYVDVEWVPPIWLLALVVAAMFFAATFSVYKEVAGRIPKSADLAFRKRAVHFYVSSWTKEGVPSHDFKNFRRFEVEFDLVNGGQEVATLTEIKITKLKTNSELFGGTPISDLEVLKFEHPHASQVVTLPKTVQGMQRENNLRLQFMVNLSFISPSDFVQRLMKLHDFEIEIAYSFEDFAGVKHDRQITICDSFDEFKRNTIQRFRDDGKNNLLYKVAMYLLEELKGSPTPSS